GSNSQGELGASLATSFRVVPEPVSAFAGRTPLAIGAGDSFSLAVRQTDTPLVAPANDAFSAASALDSLPAAVSGNTLLATLEPSEPASGTCGAVGRTVWYRIAPTTSGRLIASSSGSLFDTRLSLFSGDSLTNLTAVACDAASLNTPVEAGKTY